MQPPLLSLLLLLQLFASVLNAAAPPQVNLCYSVRTTNGATPPFYVTKFAIEYYRATFPNYNWTLVPISNGNFNPTIRDSVQSMVNQGASCDALLGPGSSSYSVALSPVVNQPWIDFASTSTDLSDKSVYTWFNRVITTDAQIGGAMADVLLGMGWRYVNLLTSNDAYGSSIAEQLTASFVASGSFVVISQKLPISATLAAAHAYLDLLEQGSNSRIIAVGTANGNPLYANIINATLTRGLQNKYVFLFSESACGGDAQWHALPGALCVTFSVNSTMSGPLLSAYLARDMTSDIAMAAQYGRPTSPTTAQLTTFNVFTAFAHDAVLAMMAAINSLGGTYPLPTSRVLSAVRNVSFPGLTGRVFFDKNGDRGDLQVLVLNVVPGGVEQPIGYVTNHLFVKAYNTSQVDPIVPYWLSSYYSITPPSDLITSTFQIAIWMIVLAVGCLVLVLLLALGGLIARRNREAVEKMLSMGLFEHFGKALLTLAVMSVKTLTAVNLYFAGVSLGYLIPYYIVVGFGVISGFAEVFQRVRYVVTVALATEPLSISEELEFEQAVRTSTVVTTVMSDTPSVVLSCVILDGGSAGNGAAQSLMLAQIVLSSFFIGMKITIIQEILMALVQSHDEEDVPDSTEDDAVVESSSNVLDPGDAGALVVSPSLASHRTGTSTPKVGPSPQFDSSVRSSVQAIDDPVTASSAQLARETKFVQLGRAAVVEWKRQRVSSHVVARLIVPEILRCYELSTDDVRGTANGPRGFYGASFQRLPNGANRHRLSATLGQSTRVQASGTTNDNGAGDDGAVRWNTILSAAAAGNRDDELKTQSVEVYSLNP